LLPVAAAVVVNVTSRGIAPVQPAIAITALAPATSQPPRLDTRFARREAPNGEIIVTNCDDTGPGNLHLQPADDRVSLTQAAGNTSAKLRAMHGDWNNSSGRNARRDATPDCANRAGETNLKIA